MSNEELVVEIQKGRADLMEVLWSQVERFVGWKAKRIIAQLPDVAGVEFEDLYNSGYLAMVEAIPGYKPEEGKFTSWLALHLKTAFAEAYGCRSERQKQDPIHRHRSIDAPIRDEDGNETPLADLIEDPSARDAICSVEHREFCEELRGALDALMSDLPEGCAEVLQLRYYQDLTTQAVAERTGIDSQRVRNLEQKAIRTLRQPIKCKHLRPFWEFDCYHGTGLGAFRSSGLSVQERYIVKQEQAQAPGRDCWR